MFIFVGNHNRYNQRGGGSSPYHPHLPGFPNIHSYGKCIFSISIPTLFFNNEKVFAKDNFKNSHLLPDKLFAQNSSIINQLVQTDS